MATKKLKAELEVDTSKARQKVAREFAETGGAAAGGGVSDAAGEAARNLKNLSNGAQEASVNMRAAVKAFAGMGIGLATSYAQAMMEPGSTGQRAVGYIGAMASGAMMGSIAGPWGSAAGAGLGLIKEGFNQSAQDKAAEKSKDDQLRSIREWERAREQTLAFKETLEQLTTEGGDAKEKMAALTAEIEKRKEIDANLANTQRHAVATGNAAMLAEATAFRSRNAGQIDALGAALKQMEKQNTGGGAADWNGVDALSSVGGMFAGAGAGARAIEDIAGTAEAQLKVLERIERNTQEGGDTWQ